jgi:hypothetical protein
MPRPFHNFWRNPYGTPYDDEVKDKQSKNARRKKWKKYLKEKRMRTGS